MRTPTQIEVDLLARLAAAGAAGYTYIDDNEWEMAVRLGASDRWIRDVCHTGEYRPDGRPLWRGVLSDHGIAALARARESEHSMPPERDEPERDEPERDEPERDDEHYHDELPPLTVAQAAEATITPTAVPIEVVRAEVVSVCDIVGCGCTALVINGAKRKRCASHAYKSKARANAPPTPAPAAEAPAPEAPEVVGADRLATLTTALRETRDAARWGAKQAAEEIERLTDKIKELRVEKETAEADLIRFLGVDRALTDILGDEPQQGTLPFNEAQG